MYSLNCDVLIKQAADMVPNIEICNILLFQSRHDFSYKLMILHTMKRFGIRPNKKFIADLETTLSDARHMIIDKVNEFVLL
jgi:hypothetical protein